MATQRTIRDNGNGCSERNHEMRELYHVWLKAKPQVDPVDQLFYRQALAAAARGSALKEDYIKGNCTLDYYLAHEERASTGTELHIKSRA